MPNLHPTVVCCATRMPTCAQCQHKRSIDDYSDAQLVRGSKGRCLKCSNPRLWAQREASGLGDRPLCDLGRSRHASKGIADGSIECSSCRRELPRTRFSSRQLAGKRRCHSCAASASATNLTQQAEQALKRQRDGAVMQDSPCKRAATTDGEDGESVYVEQLLQDVNAARDAAVQAKVEAVAVAPPPRPVGEGNAGYALLQRLGWAPGTGLGANGRGDVELASDRLPSQLDRRGLGRAVQAADEHREEGCDGDAEGDGSTSHGRAARPVAFVSASEGVV